MKSSSMSMSDMRSHMQKCVEDLRDVMTKPYKRSFRAKRVKDRPVAGKAAPRLSHRQGQS